MAQASDAAVKQRTETGDMDFPLVPSIVALEWDHPTNWVHMHHSHPGPQLQRGRCARTLSRKTRHRRRTVFHDEGGTANNPKVYHIQLRSDPLAE
jgi:hypothetical protein